mgnify:FL=1|tara:strand:- start:93 stop:683 length:591 start_codon:yes stop_codon:yes gene_type:complete
MSKRIGKYKVDGRNQALSAIDGGVISGNLSGITNLTTTGTNTLSGATTFGVLRHRQKVTQLVDVGGSGGAFTALTQADSGTHFLVPALTGGVHTMALPAVNAANVGWHARFTAVGTLAQIFKLQTAETADKIITNEPDGNGDVTVTVNSNEFHMLAAAEKGAAFSITMISATAAIAFMVHDLTPGIAANTGEFVDA